MNEPEPVDMLNDKREIWQLLSLPDMLLAFSTSATGPNGCEKIVAYAENGHMAPIPFLAVYQRGRIAQRIPANFVVVVYR